MSLANTIEMRLWNLFSHLGERFDRLLRPDFDRAVGNTLTTSLLSETIEKAIIRHHGQDYAPHVFKLHLGLHEHQAMQVEDRIKLVDDLRRDILCELKRRRLRVLAPVNILTTVNLFSNRTTLQASFGDLSGRLKTTDNSLPPEVDKMVLIEVEHQPELSTTYCFRPGQTRLYIGRNPLCELVLASDAVAPVHAVLFLDLAGQLFVSDLGSETGTCLGHEKIPSYKAIRLPNNAGVVVGDTVVDLTYHDL